MTSKSLIFSAGARRFAALAATATLLATSACGAASSATSSAPSQGAPGDRSVAVGGPGFAAADAETAKLGTTAAPGVFPRTITHAEGTTEIKTKPQRIVALDTGEIDDLISLGITPVGIITTGGANPIPSYLADKVKGVQQVGDISNLNLEAIAALKPDLIISSKLRHDKMYSQLSQIAPTVFSIRAGFPWKENFRLVAAALGEENKATQVMNEYSLGAEKVKKTVNGRKITVSMVRFMPGKLRLYANKSMIGVVLKDSGLARPPKQDIDDLAVEVSAENIGQADGDLLFWSSYGDPAATGETTTLNSTAWKAIPAVAQGRAHRVNDDSWFLGLGPTGAQQVLKDLDGFVASA